MKVKVLMLLIGCLTLSKIHGQEIARKLTFKEAVKIGLEKNLNLNQQENFLISSQVNKSSGLLAMAPSINITGNAGRNDGNSFNQQQGQVVNGVIDFFGANANANLPLFSGLSNFNTYRQAANQYEAQLHLVKRTNQDVIRNVASQYLTCLLDMKLLEIQNQNQLTQQQQYDQLKEQVAAGSRAEVELVNQEFQVRNAELLALRAGITLRNDLATLAQILQLDPMISLELENPDWDINLADSEVSQMEELSQLALESRGDLAQARFNQKASQFGYQSAKGNYFPSINLFAQYGSRYNFIKPSANFTPDNRSFSDQFFTDNKQLTYGVTFAIPILGGFQSRNNAIRSKILYENAKLESENAEITVKSDVLRAYQNYRDARKNYEAASTQLKAAQLSYDLEGERFRLGVSDIVVFTLANQNFVRAQGDFANASYTLMFQKLLINYAAGTLKFDDIP